MQSLRSLTMNMQGCAADDVPPERSWVVLGSLLFFFLPGDPDVFCHIAVGIQPPVGCIPHVVSIRHVSEVLHQGGPTYAVPTFTHVVYHTVLISIRVPHRVEDAAGFVYGIERASQEGNITRIVPSRRLPRLEYRIVRDGLEASNAIVMMLDVLRHEIGAAGVVTPIPGSQK